MKTKSGVCMLLLIVSLFFIPAAVLGANSSLPNGFQSGPHFNLNIHGKNADFFCPPQEYYLQVTADNNADGDYGQLVKTCDWGDVCVPTTTPIYGNSIFIPETTTDKITVYVESGKKGPKSAPATAELQVTDWCAGFGGGDTSVKFRLPANEAGYNVYARILAKPTYEPYLTFSDPGLVYAEDEDGELVWLGSLTSDGFQTPSYTFIRSKGKSTAQDITGLFKWAGDLCYTTNAEGRTYTPFCQTLSAPPTYYEDLDLETPGLQCIAGDVATALFCSTITTPEWVFNIADFVEMFFGIDNSGSKLVQLRFYPL